MAFAGGKGPALMAFAGGPGTSHHGFHSNLAPLAKHAKVGAFLPSSDSPPTSY